MVAPGCERPVFGIRRVAVLTSGAFPWVQSVVKPSSVPEILFEVVTATTPTFLGSRSFTSFMISSLAFLTNFSMSFASMTVIFYPFMLVVENKLLSLWRRSSLSMLDCSSSRDLGLFHFLSDFKILALSEML